VSDDRGETSLERLREHGSRPRLDTVALVWMVFVLAITAATVYSALRFGNITGYAGESDWWLKLRLLASSGGTIAVFGSAIGVVLAVVFAGARSRVALRLATVGGMWAGVAGVVGVVVVFHNESVPGESVAFDGRVSDAAVFAVFAALGVIVATVAWRFSRSEIGSELG